MTSKYNKTIVLVGLFAIVLTVGILAKTDTGQGYISWLKASASNIFGMNAEAPSDEGIGDNIDYSNININGAKDDATQTPVSQTPSETQSVSAVVVPVSQTDIEATIKDISQQVAKIDMEVKEMTVNNEIQRQIDQIAVQVDKVGQDVNILRTNAEITEIQQQISVLSQQISLLTQQLSVSA